MTVRRAHLVLYVADRAASTAFYRAVLATDPTLDVEGMTEFQFGETVFGLMPERGITRLLRGAIDPAAAAGASRAELYLVVDDAAAYHQRALASGAKELDPLSERSWGARVAYSLDPDGAVLAFASEARSVSATSVPEHGTCCFAQRVEEEAK